MEYLFWAHIVCWAGLFIYSYSLLGKGGDLEKQIEALNKQIKK